VSSEVIPDKRYFTIGEVADICDVKPHVLRYWEREVPQLSDVSRRQNRRYYQRDEVDLLLTIKKLLREDGFTIDGARGQLKAHTKSVEKRSGPTVEAPMTFDEKIQEIISILKGA
jgi:DNA-binding transcriptional MerR regulator